MCMAKINRRAIWSKYGSNRYPIITETQVYFDGDKGGKKKKSTP